MKVVSQNAVNPFHGSTDGEREILNRVGADVESFERGIGRDFKDNCDKWYRQYRGFNKWADAWVRLGTREDRDGFLRSSKKNWGSSLHIPLTYRAIEDGVPKAIAHRPKLLVLPRHPQWESNVENVRLLIDAQQEQVDIELSFQDVLKSGYIYGLGVGKALWRKEYAYKRVQRRRMFRPNVYRLSRLLETCTFDDPDFEDVDVFDFMWDPFGSDIRTCKWVVHRMWLGLGDVMARLQSRTWNTASAQQLDEETVRSMGNSQKYDEVWQQRMEASGLSMFQTSIRGEQIHEVWEWHDGHRVVTVLDRQVLVQDAESPCVGQIPFMVYRPTRVPKQMVGIGEVEPMEHLQRELDTLRSQRRDAATLALAAGYAYDRNAVDEEDLVFGPAAAIPVRNARPQDAIMPLPVRDVPGSSWQEEAALKSDIERVTGVNDALAGGDGGSIGTATEAQLVQASLSKRVELKARRFEVEVVRPAARSFLTLNQRMILTDRQMQMQIPPDEDPVTRGTTKRYLWFDVGPAELMGEFTVMPEGGALAAENTAQKRQDAQMLWAQFREHPDVNQRELLMRVLELQGIKRPETMLNQAEPPVPVEVLEVFARMFGPEAVQTAIAAAQRQSPHIPPPSGPAGGDQTGQQQQIEGAAA